MIDNYYSFYFIVLLILTSSENTTNTKINTLSWKDINISLPHNTSHQVVGYYPNRDEVYLFGGNNVENEYWSLKFNQSYNGWSENNKYRFEDLNIFEYQQSYFSSLHNIIYIKTGGYIHIYDMEIDYFNENVIELPINIIDGCMTVYYDEIDSNIEYLIIIGSKRELINNQPTTWIYKINWKTHNVSFFDIGPDLIGIRRDFCCTVLNNYLYVIGGIYDSQQTRFIEEWLIDIDTDYNFNIDSQTNSFDNFTNINTLINTDLANQYLPQFGHRCIVNNNKKQIYVIGGITMNDDDDDDEISSYDYSKYILILKRDNDSLSEINYPETKEEELSHPNQIIPKILPNLPISMAYTSAMIDQYGYLNLFGGQLNPEKDTNKWFRINTKYDNIYDITNDDEIDIIWRNHRRHNNNEQWALLILLASTVLIAAWFKCISKITKLRGNIGNGIGRHPFSDGTAYDEITATSEIDDLVDDNDDEKEYNIDDDDDDIDDDIINNESSDDENYLNRIIANHDEIEEHNSEVVV